MQCACAIRLTPTSYDLPEPLDAGLDPVGADRREAEPKTMAAGVFVHREHISRLDHNALGARGLREPRRVGPGLT